MHEDYTISQLKTDSKKLGIEGFVYEMLSWDKQYERAVLAVSSDWVKSVVVPDFETLVSLAQVARDKKLPKLKIIPLNTIPEFHMKLPKTSGLLGILSDYVQCDRKYIPIAKFLFGNVILTKTRHDAHELSKVGYKAVSINGEFFESKSSAVIIDINSKINKLTKIISQSSSVEGLFKTINLLSNLIQKKKSNLKKIDQIHGDSLERLQLAETEFGNASYSKSSLKSQINSAHNLNAQLSQRILELQKQKTNLFPKIIHFSSSIESLQQRIKLVNQNYSNNEQNSIANQLNLLNNKKSHLNAEQSKIMKVLSEETAKISVVEDRKRFRKEALLGEKSSISKEKMELKSTITTFQANIDASEQVLIKLREKEQELISTSGTSVSKLSEYDEKLDVRKGKERGITNELNRLVRESDGLDRDLLEIKSNESSLKKILDLFDLISKRSRSSPSDSLTSRLSSFVIPRSFPFLTSSFSSYSDNLETDVPEVEINSCSFSLNFMSTCSDASILAWKVVIVDFNSIFSLEMEDFSPKSASFLNLFLSSTTDIFAVSSLSTFIILLCSAFRCDFLLFNRLS
jgi:chromosome segregation protein